MAARNSATKVCSGIRYSSAASSTVWKSPTAQPAHAMPCCMNTQNVCGHRRMTSLTVWYGFGLRAFIGVPRVMLVPTV